MTIQEKIDALELAAMILQDKADELRALPLLRPATTPLAPVKPLPGLATPVPDLEAIIRTLTPGLGNHTQPGGGRREIIPK